MNLTSLNTDHEIITKHFLDSLAAFKLFDARPGLRVLDVGTGAGFPGIVLKLQAPDLAVTLLEPSTRKGAFLHHIIGSLGILSTKIVRQRVEDFSDNEKFHLVTGRALRLGNLLSAARRLLVPGGRVLVFRIAEFEESPAGYEIARQLSFTLPFTHDQRSLALLKIEGDRTNSPLTILPVLS